MASQQHNAHIAATESDSRWASVQARDASADDSFVYAVRTTGVYCRPSCPARTALAANVTFHATCEAAEAAGYRACKRCTPNATSLARRNHDRIVSACQMIERSETLPGLERLAAAAGISPFHFHRVFRAATGLTPRQYGAARRAERLRAGLSGSGTVTETIYEAGYNTSSRFYETSKEVLGMTPSQYRAGGENTDIRFAIGECSLGSVLVAASTIGVCAILIGDDPEALVRDLQDRFPRANLIGGEAAFEDTVAQVVAMIDTPGKGLDLPLDMRGTAFQQKVWTALRAIPSGQTVNYTDIARAIGAPKSFRAVAQACGANKIAVAIPCHRVVRTDGGISGYRWGVERKRKLLEREAKS